MGLKQVGILSMDDLLKRRFQTPMELGLDTIQASLQADLATHNRILNDAYSYLVGAPTNVRRERYGVSGSLQFRRGDEFSRAHTQKVITGSEVNYPMIKYDAAIGWTAMFFQQKTVADMAQTQVAAKVGHVLLIRAEMQRALFLSANYSTVDELGDNLPLAVKRFVNADSAPIPIGPNGETFNAATHTVVEHRAGAQPIVFINAADQTAWQGLTDFKALPDPRLTVDYNVQQPLQKLDLFNVGDRAIGIFGQATVWVKPWAIANYAVCLDVANPNKPLALRTPDGAPLTLATVATNVLFPLQAEYMQSLFGFAVRERTGGAILYHLAGAVAYVDPTIA
jgi:hypothetical protein